MDPRIVKRLVLPAALVVTTFVSANACKYDPSAEEYCIDIETKSDCNSAAGCGWSDQDGLCLNICDQIETQMECEAIDRCVWDLEGDTGGTDTGGGGACHEPFT